MPADEKIFIGDWLSLVRGAKWYLKTSGVAVSPWHSWLSTGKIMAIGVFKPVRGPCSQSKKMHVGHHLQNILVTHWRKGEAVS